MLPLAVCRDTDAPHRPLLQAPRYILQLSTQFIVVFSGVHFSLISCHCCCCCIVLLVLFSYALNTLFQFLTVICCYYCCRCLFLFQLVFHVLFSAFYLPFYCCILFVVVLTTATLQRSFALSHFGRAPSSLSCEHKCYVWCAHTDASTRICTQTYTLSKTHTYIERLLAAHCPSAPTAIYHVKSTFRRFAVTACYLFISVVFSPR